MTLLLLPVLLLAPTAALPPLPFSAETNTWSATHIVVVQDGKVAESWLGDFKPGDALPEGADRFSKMPAPPLSKGTPGVTGKRKVVFLAHVPLDGTDRTKKVWTGACSAGHHANPAYPTSVAWVEGDRAFVAVGAENGGYELIEHTGGVAAIRRRVDDGLALRKTFAEIKAEPDAAKRAARLVEFKPTATRYDSSAGGDVVVEVGKCGAAAVPHLVTWYTTSDPSGYALVVLCGLGDVGYDAVAKLLDAEAAFWAKAAKADGASANKLYHLLHATRTMKLSAENVARLRKHEGLTKLDELLATKPELKPARSDVVSAHEILRDILAGKFQH